MKRYRKGVLTTMLMLMMTGARMMKVKYKETDDSFSHRRNVRLDKLMPRNCDCAVHGSCGQCHDSS